MLVGDAVAVTAELLGECLLAEPLAVLHGLGEDAGGGRDELAVPVRVLAGGCLPLAARPGCGRIPAAAAAAAGRAAGRLPCPAAVPLMPAVGLRQDARSGKALGAADTAGMAGGPAALRAGPEVIRPARAARAASAVA